METLAVNYIYMRVIILTLLASLLLPGCSLFPSIIYRIDVQQGNVVTQEMVDTLKPGMSKAQVRFVLGSPLIVDTFRENRWDYVYLLQEKGRLIDKQTVTIFFEDDRLTHIESHSLPVTSPASEPELITPSTDQNSETEE
ncbi:MAG: outer membrane protein assembly factor BamE [Nitrosomonas sp.]|nr:outer membrane protein assembly factor BamE [Nitrosomonas sp.]MDP1951238.1 outer membrane protein assembly factor BamE [Nitrosomonas sp.]